MREGVITAYTAAAAEACADLYNRVLGRLPTFVAVDGESLHRGVTAPESFHDEVADGTALLATGAGGLSGWAAVCRRRPGPEAPWDAVVRGLCVPAVEPGTVAELLAAVRAWAGGGRVVIGGSGGPRFQNGGEAALPESTGLGPALLGCGMRLTDRVLVLQGPVEEATPAAGPAEIAAADDHGSCRAVVGGECVGECWVDPAAGFSSHPLASEHAFVQWIGTEPAWRGRGVARQMWAFTCSGLHGRGVRRISLSTPCSNFDAQAFYFRVGLQVVDHGLGFEGPAQA